jgi:hypothetical protein
MLKEVRLFAELRDIMDVGRISQLDWYDYSVTCSWMDWRAVS